MYLSLEERGIRKRAGHIGSFECSVDSCGYFGAMWGWWIGNRELGSEPRRSGCHWGCYFLGEKKLIAEE